MLKMMDSGSMMCNAKGAWETAGGWGECSKRERTLDVSKARLSDYYIHSTYEARWMEARVWDNSTTLDGVGHIEDLMRPCQICHTMLASFHDPCISGQFHVIMEYGGESDGEATINDRRMRHRASGCRYGNAWLHACRSQPLSPPVHNKATCADMGLLNHWY